MTAFRKDLHSEQGAFELESIESTGARGELIHEVTLPDGLDGYAVLIEAQVKGEGEAFHVAMEVDGKREGAEALDRLKQKGHGAFLHTGQQPAGGTKLRFNLFASAGARVKVSVLKVFRRAKEYALSKLSCEGCKKVLRFVLSSLLAQFGVVLTPDDFIPVDLLPAGWVDALRDLGKTYDTLPKPVRDVLEFAGTLFKGALIDILKGMADILKEAFKPLDYALKTVCTKVGCCAAE